jgi:hypothetical protein
MADTANRQMITGAMARRATFMACGLAWLG